MTATPTKEDSIIAKTVDVVEAVFSSVKTTIVLLSLVAISVLIGAWCPQEAQVGKDKVIAQFGEKLGEQMIQLGIADIFHSPWFLLLIGLLSLNMIAGSMKHVFPKLKLLRLPMPALRARDIRRLPVNVVAGANGEPQEVTDSLIKRLRRQGFIVRVNDRGLTAHWGKFGRLAPTITHIGLLTLLAGVTITSWTGFTGFQPILLNSTLTFDKSEHSKLWIGKLPSWRVRVEDTRKESYENGDPKQWYSNLSVLSPEGVLLKKQEISVNNPLSYDGVDIYQSSWGLDHLLVSFNNRRMQLPLRPMGKIYASFMPLDEQTILIMSVKGPGEPLKMFAKIAEWQQPRLIAFLQPGKSAKLGSVDVVYNRVVPVTGLQYKCDPGLPVTYVAFGFIICGVFLAAVPYRQVWAAVENNENGGSTIYIGGASRKAKRAFEQGLNRLIASLVSEFGEAMVHDVECDESANERARCANFDSATAISTSATVKKCVTVNKPAIAIATTSATKVD
jgi:cytochrome c biogenesis protein